jgi:hypothetical protein
MSSLSVQRVEPRRELRRTSSAPAAVVRMRVVS